MGWSPDIGKDPAWWLGVIVGFTAVISTAVGWALTRKFVRR